MDGVSLHDVSKSYGHIRALSNVSLCFAAGKRYGIAGPNGAGKSTLVKIISGLLRPDSGEVCSRGRKVSQFGPREALEHGIATIHQGVPLVPTLNIEQNILLGREGRLANLRQPFRRAFEAIRSLIPSNECPSNLGPDQVFLIHLCRSLLWEPSAIVLDEATSRVTADAKARVHELLSPLVEDGLTLLNISHELEELYDTCDELIGLRDGRIVSEVSVASLDPDSYRQSIFGNDVEAARPPTQLAGTEVKFAVTDLKVACDLPKVTFSVTAGETLCIYLDGDNFGRHLFEAIVGWRTALHGELCIEQQRFRKWSRETLRRMDVVWIPAEPQRCAFAHMSIAENLAYCRANSIARYGILRPRDVRGFAERIILDYAITPYAPNMLFAHLSGGNQQKAIIGRELVPIWLQEVSVIIAYCPMIGLDERARSRLRIRLRMASELGIPIIYGSTDLRECEELAGTLVRTDQQLGLVSL